MSCHWSERECNEGCEIHAFQIKSTRRHGGKLSDKSGISSFLSKICINFNISINIHCIHPLFSQSVTNAGGVKFSHQTYPCKHTHSTCNNLYRISGTKNVLNYCRHVNNRQNFLWQLT